MKGQPQSSKQFLHVITLLLTLMLSSCEQAGYLTCPVIPYSETIIPLGPYDEDRGDCALLGKSEEIEIWLIELESIAESCLARRESNWTDTQAIRDDLDTKIDLLQEVIKPTPTGDQSEMGGMTQIDLPCLNIGNSVPEEDSPGSSSPPTHHYTDWLMRIGANVGKYCTLIDEFVKPLQEACIEINQYQECQAPIPELYHSIVESKMNAAQIKYESTEFFYTNTLQISGWDAFRSNFKEPSIDCNPTQSPPDNPNFLFSMNAFCRQGPSTEYEEVMTFLELQSVQIVGRNQDEPRWWWVEIPGSNDHCWVSDSTGTAADLLMDLEIILAPTLEENQDDIQCSKDLGPIACTSAGGTWKQSPLGPFYCDCK